MKTYRLDRVAAPETPKNAPRGCPARSTAASGAATRAKQNPWREVEEIASQIDAETKDFETQTTRLYELAKERGGDLASIETEATKARGALAAKLAAIAAARPEKREAKMIPEEDIRAALARADEIISEGKRDAHAADVGGDDCGDCGHSYAIGHVVGARRVRALLLELLE